MNRTGTPVFGNQGGTQASLWTVNNLSVVQLPGYVWSELAVGGASPLFILPASLRPGTRVTSRVGEPATLLVRFSSCSFGLGDARNRSPCGQSFKVETTMSCGCLSARTRKKIGQCQTRNQRAAYLLSQRSRETASMKIPKPSRHT